jgi:HAD superfamily hydrolase (TIGR01509 family)
VLCAAPAYLARRGTPRTLAELPGHDCLVIKERDHPFGDWFEDGVFSARVQHAKPDDGIYHCAVERLSLHGQAPVFVDDMPRNVATAQRLGWRPVQFDTADQVRRQLQAWGLLG